MAMRINKIDFNNIQSRVDAARSLQDASEYKAAEDVLKKLAEEILEDFGNGRS